MYLRGGKLMADNKFFNSLNENIQDANDVPNNICLEKNEKENIDPKVPLKIFEQGKPDEFGRPQLFATAVSVFLKKNGKTLLMRQTKSHSVVGDNYVGLGGKDLLNTYLGKNTGEKVPTEIVISSLISGEFGSKDSPEDTAVKEIFEETGGETKTENGEVIKTGYGINLNREKLSSIGSSQVKLHNKKSNEVWQIFYYTYELDGSEGQINEEYCDEGNIEWVDDDKILDKNMFPADRVILQNQNPNITVEAIYDDIDNIHKLRTVFSESDTEITYVLVNDYNKPKEYIGQTAILENNEELMNMFKGENINKSFINELLRAYSNKKVVKEFEFPSKIEFAPIKKQREIDER